MRNKCSKINIIILTLTTLIIASAVLVIRLTANASEPVTEIGSTALGLSDYESLTQSVIKICLEHDVIKLSSNSNYFTNECYQQLCDFVVDNDMSGLESEDYKIGLIATDAISVMNSSTDDTVLMTTVKIWYNGESYNRIYTFEWHINKNGKIYGYNVWVH